MTPQDAIDQLTALGDADKAASLLNSYKIDRPYLGVGKNELDRLYKDWRTHVDGPDRTALAAELWDSNIHEARLVAAKLLTQARINPDDHVWAEITRWITELDHATIADAACGAGARRLMAHPERMAEVSGWITSEDSWMRRSAMTITLPLTKLYGADLKPFAVNDACKFL